MKFASYHFHLTNVHYADLLFIDSLTWSPMSLTKIDHRGSEYSDKLNLPRCFQNSFGKVSLCVVVIFVLSERYALFPRLVTLSRWFYLAQDRKINIEKDLSGHIPAGTPCGDIVTTSHVTISHVL